VFGDKSEIQYCQSLAAQHKQGFKQEKSFVELIVVIAEMFNEERKQIEEEEFDPTSEQLLPWIDDWYTRYSYVFLKTISQMRPLINTLQKHEDKASQYLDKIYGCMFAAIRFM
jgi:hypothetical protein